MDSTNHDLDQACLYGANNAPLPEEERHQRRRLRRRAEAWVAKHGERLLSEGKTYQQAADECYGFLGIGLGGLILSAFLSWLVWRVLNRWFPEAPEPPRA